MTEASLLHHSPKAIINKAALTSVTSTAHWLGVIQTRIVFQNPSVLHWTTQVSSHQMNHCLTFHALRNNRMVVHTKLNYGPNVSK